MFARIAVLLALVSSAAADTNLPVPTDPSSNITIKLVSPVTSVPRYGFVPVRVAIENITTHDGVWKFRFTAGAPGAALAVGVSTFELAVPAAQTRETWFFVPLAEPGISPNTAAAALPSVSTTSNSGMPPMIPDVYPTSPAGVGRPILTRQSTTLSPSGGLLRTFSISQTGPAAKLPMLPPSKLPPNSSVSISPPNAAGEVTRVTVVTVEVISGPRAMPSSTSAFTSAQSMSALSNARAKLVAAGLEPPVTSGVQTRTSVRVSVNGNVAEHTIVIQQTGPSAELPLPDLKTLPAGFTSVNVTPGRTAGEVGREFVYVEKNLVTVSPPAPTFSTSTSIRGGGGGGGLSLGTAGFAGGGTVVGGPAAMSPSVAESEARKLLAASGLLTVPSTVSTTAQARSMTVTNPGGSIFSASAALTVFEQLGPTGALRVPPAGSLPAEVRVSVHPTSTPGIAVRVITVPDPAVQAALRAAVLSGASNDRMSLARLELMRLGYLRSDPKITQSFSTRSASGSAGVPDLLVFTESGPAALLPDAPAGTLPPGITCKVTPGLMAGEVARNFLVDSTALATAAPSIAAPTVATSGATLMPRPIGAALSGPSSLVVDVSGPGVTAPGRVTFPNLAPSPLPPMAIGSGLEAAVRAKLVNAYLRTLPNLASVDPATLPADWRVWSSFNSVLLKADDFAALDAGRRAALRGWVALGGVLYLSPAAVGEAQVERLGAGRIETFPEPLADAAPRDVTTSLQLGTLSPGIPNRDLLRFAPGSPMGDMVKFEGADVLWLTIFLVVFAVVVGPVNLFLLAPPAKRHRLFVTTPLISLVGAIAVAAAIVFQDGFGGDGVRRALVVFLPGENQAAVFQEQATHTGFLLRREFPLEDGVLCAVLPTDEQSYVNPMPTPPFFRAAGQAGGEWFRNRARQAQLLRQLAPTRARVEVVALTVGDAPVVESTLATELRDFRLRDESDNYWFADSVSPGRRVTLRKETAEAAAAGTREFGGDGTPALTTVMSAATLRTPWQWAARGGPTDVAPLKTLPAIRWKDHAVTYTGIAEAGAVVARAKPPAPPPAEGEKGGQ